MVVPCGVGTCSLDRFATSTSGMKRLAVISGFDSQFKWGGQLGKKFFGAGYDVQFFCPEVRHNQVSDAQLKSYDIPFPINWCQKSEIFSSLRLLEFDVVLISLPAGLTEEGTLSLKRTFEEAATLYPDNPSVRRRPIIVAGFVGINYENRIGSVVARRLTDIVLANSEEERRFLNETAQRLSLTQPTIVTAGLGLIDSGNEPRHAPKAKRRRRVLFAAQPTVPKTKAEKIYLLLKLRELAKAQPDWTVALKPRHRPGEGTFHKDDNHLEDLARDFLVVEDIPPNLIFDYRPIVTQLSETDLVMTVSSTAAVEAHAAGIPIAIVTDFGIKEPYGAEFFADCGALATFDEIKKGAWPTLNAAWVARNVAYSNQHFSEVLAAIDECAARQRASGTMLPFADTAYDVARAEAIEFIEEWRAARRKTAWVKEVTSGAVPISTEPRKAMTAPTLVARPTPARGQLDTLRRKTRKLLRDPEAFFRDSRYFSRGKDERE